MPYAEKRTNVFSFIVVMSETVLPQPQQRTDIFGDMTMEGGDIAIGRCAASRKETKCPFLHGGRDGIGLLQSRLRIGMFGDMTNERWCYHHLFSIQLQAAIYNRPVSLSFIYHRCWHIRC